MLVKILSIRYYTCDFLFPLAAILAFSFQNSSRNISKLLFSPYIDTQVEPKADRVLIVFPLNSQYKELTMHYHYAGLLYGVLH